MASETDDLRRRELAAEGERGRAAWTEKKRQVGVVGRQVALDLQEAQMALEDAQFTFEERAGQQALGEATEEAVESAQQRVEALSRIVLRRKAAVAGVR